MKRRRRTTITREGWYYLVVLAFVVAGAMLREINLLMFMAGMMFGPMLLNWRMVVAGLRPLTVSRRAPEDVAAGEMLIVDVGVQSRPARIFPRFSFGAWAVTVEDTIRRHAGKGSGESFHPSVLFWRVPRGQAQRINYRGRLLRRGRYKLGPLIVSTRFPLGLVRRTLVVKSMQDLTVLPRTGLLTAAWDRLYRRALVGSRGRQSQQAVMEGEFHSLRDWRSGDARRSIHWRTTARRRTPVVRQFEQQRSRDLILLLDLRPSNSKATVADDAVERAVSFAATVATEVCRRGGGHLVLALAGRESTVLRGSATTTLLPRCMTDLSEVEAGDGRHFEKTLEEALRWSRTGASLIVVSTHKSKIEGLEVLQNLQADPRSRGVNGVLMLSSVGEELAEYFADREIPVAEFIS